MKSRPVYPDRKGGIRFWYKGSWVYFNNGQGCPGDKYDLHNSRRIVSCLYRSIQM